MSVWNCLSTGPGSGAFNMALDVRLAEELQAGTGGQTLRLYFWRPWAISLGHHQSEEEIDAAACARQGIELVRRPTGGRAILHAEELTYSVVMHCGRAGIQEVSNRISRALVAGLREFGADVTLERAQPQFPVVYRRASSVPCFSTAARYEIVWKGRKLVGSAQRRYAYGDSDVVLQHGSILCGPAHRDLTRYLSSTDPEVLRQVEEDLRMRTVDLREITGREVDREYLALCIRHGFEKSWAMRFQDVTGYELLMEASRA